MFTQKLATILPDFYQYRNLLSFYILKMNMQKPKFDTFIVNPKKMNYIGIHKTCRSYMKKFVK